MSFKLSEEQYQRVLNVIWEGTPLSTLQTSEELHDYAWNYNWDDGFDNLRWVINNPLCSKGTALLIYWYSQPGYFLKFDRSEISVYQLDHFDFIQELQQNLLNGDFKHNTIAFDPRNDEGYDWIQENEAGNNGKSLNLPKELYEPAKGREMIRGAY